MPNFEPVELPKETIESILTLRNGQGREDAYIVSITMQYHNSKADHVPDYAKGLLMVDINTLMRALVVSWTEKLTLEDDFVAQVRPYIEGDDEEVLSGFARALKIIAKHDERYRHLASWANENNFYGTPGKVTE